METFKTVRGVPTKVVCYGKHVDDDLNDVNFLILVFPGNPGLVDYYKEFMTEIHRFLSDKYPDTPIPVWAISHAGHQRDDLAHHLFPSLEENEHLYSLEGQCNHKFEFVKEYIPSHIKVTGIGHSIGCKAWSEVIKMLDVARGTVVDPQVVIDEKIPESLPEVVKCFMLFPTLEHMAKTPNGKWFTGLIPYYGFLEPFVRLVTVLPTLFHRMMLNVYFFGKSVPDSVKRTSLQIFRSDIFHKILYMAKCEMEFVLDLDVATLDRNLDKLFFCFSQTDGWMPLEYVDDMKNKFPKMKFQICERGVEHAFVIKHSVLIAEAICSQLDIYNK